MKKLLFSFIIFSLTIGIPSVYAEIGKVDFEDLTLDPESFWNGSDESGGFISRGVHFSNNYNVEWGSWDGFSYSNTTDTTTTGFDNQYSAIPGNGADGSSNYTVGYIGFASPPTATLPEVQAVSGMYVTNSTYAALTVLNGDDFAKRFGGASGDDPDWFKLTVTGKDAEGNIAGTVEFYLADYRFPDNAEDYVLTKWAWVDLSSLGAIKSLEFTLSSSDMGGFGMNTPAYVAMDNLNSSDPSGSISGRITSNVLGYTAPVKGAWVYLKGLGKSGQTDENGEYAFSNLAGGSYELLVKANNFEAKQIQNIQVFGGANTDVPDPEGMLTITSQLPGVPGDANLDGVTDLRDAIIILQWMSGIRTQP